ncbi:21325_t:CDS:2 [Cetraspora pellucida]|uniref:21325_t:CDS:1 n=1 Tax=Cetraspora pellucida TaxID=1433469 RepID=A0A9N8ZDK5_9GLOM|nr:21325_t:CDS:2 [Cetraspora pellucida]
MGRASSKAHSTDEKREVDYYQSLNIDFDQLDGARERLSLQHDILREIFYGNFSSPINNLLQAGDAKVLNIGCGNGVWLFEMNSDFPDSFLVGIDKSPQLFPQSKPSNVQFVISDMQKGLPFQSDSFDFIYMRFLALNFRDSEWDNLIKESIRVLKPGCWLEITDVETDVKNPGPCTTKMTNEAIKFLSKRSINPQVIFLTEEFIKSCNTHNIQHMERYLPLEAWELNIKTWAKL